MDTDYKICKYCEYIKYPNAYMCDCTKHKRVTFFDSTCEDFSREPREGQHEGDEYDD